MTLSFRMLRQPPTKRAKLDEGEDLEEAGRLLFEWMIAPSSKQGFYDTKWEKEPLLVQRGQPDYYLRPDMALFTLEDLKHALSTRDLCYGKNLDITNYKGGKRDTLNEAGAKVTLDQAMKRFQEDKCTLRVLHPQEFSDPLFRVCSLLQEWFGCVVGANVYITPPGAQGFAPHYDDVDVFILQVEGRKLWKLYQPISEETVLPEVSSGNFEQEEIGEPFLETWLEQGDLLYFPRGIIHQAETDPMSHSTHITISTVQKWTWYHYLLHALPAALRLAFEENVDMRKTLPRNFQSYMGVMYSDQEEDERRDQFALHATQLAQEALQYLPLDAASDRMAADFLHDALPPAAIPKMKSASAITLDTRIRLISKSSVRLSCEGDSICLHYSTQNTRIYHETEPKWAFSFHSPLLD